MPRIEEGAFAYEFPETWIVVKFDQAPFFSKHFSGFAGGTKGVDIVAIDTTTYTVWLIEAKDYRTTHRTKGLQLDTELAKKASGTLACLLAGRVNAGHSGDRHADRLWPSAMKLKKLRFVLHLEQRDSTSPLFPQVIDPKLIRDTLSRALRVVDPHPVGAGWQSLNSRNLGWQIAPIPAGN